MGRGIVESLEMPPSQTGALMQKLQDMLDKAFGSAPAPREPERPSEAFLQRERAFADRAKKIESLRKARVAGGGATSSAAADLIEVVRHRGHWRTRHHSKHSGPCEDQAAAILAARELARKKRDLDHTVEVRLCRTDGQIVPIAIDEEEEAGNE
jgi:hypothetical protein